MAKNQSQNMKSLNDEAVEEFYKEMSSRKSNAKDVNLLSVMQLLENAHTNILWQILQYENEDGNHPFFQSFIKDFLGLDDIGLEEKIIFGEGSGSGTQFQALSMDDKKNGKGTQNNDRRGFIDLLIKDNENVIIIENKVRGAGDGCQQLSRYFYTFYKTDSNDIKDNDIGFKDNYNNYWKGKENYNNPNIYIVYLTQDGSVEPSEDTLTGLPNKVKNDIIKVNYVDKENGLIAWIKEHVLPSMPYLNSGIFQQGIRLYVDYWEKVIESTNAYPEELVNKYVSKGNAELFSYLYQDLPSNEEEAAKVSVFQDFTQAVINKKWQNKLDQVDWGKDWGKDWGIHITRSIIQLYKKEWADLKSGIHLEFSGINSKRTNLEWQLHFESKPYYKTYETILKDPPYGYTKYENKSYIWLNDKINPQYNFSRDNNKVTEFSDEDFETLISGCITAFNESKSENGFSSLVKKIINEIQNPNNLIMEPYPKGTEKLW